MKSLCPVWVHGTDRRGLQGGGQGPHAAPRARSAQRPRPTRTTCPRAGTRSRRSKETGESGARALRCDRQRPPHENEAGCAFINASLRSTTQAILFVRPRLAHLRAREGLVRQLLTEAGVEDADLAAQVTLLVDGAYAVVGLAGTRPRRVMRKLQWPPCSRARVVS